jgi:hypothetical protein
MPEAWNRPAETGPGPLEARLQDRRRNRAARVRGVLPRSHYVEILAMADGALVPI